MTFIFFSFLNFSPQNIPTKNGGEVGLGLLQWASTAKDGGLAHSEATPSPCPPCSAWVGKGESTASGGAGKWARGAVLWGKKLG